MKTIIIFLVFCVSLVISCSNNMFSTNGETIYKTGKNMQGEKLLDKSASRIKIVRSCITCHGKKGDRMRSVSIAYKDLSDLNKHTVPYNDTLFFRFLDDDLKSDGSKADIGVIWKMSEQDKKDLWEYLKTLQRPQQKLK